MRKLFVLCLLSISFAASAQNTKPFKVNVAAGYAVPADKGNNQNVSKAGFVYTVEPQYRLINNVDVGLRIEQAFIRRPESLDKVIYFQTKAKSILSGAVTVNYSIPIGSTLQPFIGVGAGLYYTERSEQTYQSGNSTVSYPLPVTTILGGLARVGVKYGRVNVVADYNLVSDSKVTNSATNLTLEAKNSYFSIKAGFTIGGGSAD